MKNTHKLSTHLLDVVFDLTGDEGVVYHGQDHSRIVSCQPSPDEQTAVGTVTALREEHLHHHDDTQLRPGRCSVNRGTEPDLYKSN